MKSEILVKSTAKLEKEVAEVDVNVEDKELSEILNEELQRAGISGSDSCCNGENEEEV